MAVTTTYASDLANLWATQICADIRRASGIGVIQGEQSCVSQTVTFSNTTDTRAGYRWHETAENGRPILMEE